MEAREKRHHSAFFWLDDAKLLNICYNTTAPNIGLQLNEDRTTLKCYFCDTGLLISLAFSSRGIVTSRHNISPIEVKSSTNYTLTSIKKCIKKFGQYLSTPYVLHTNDVVHKDGLVYLPLYMTPLL